MRPREKGKYDQTRGGLPTLEGPRRTPWASLKNHANGMMDRSLDSRSQAKENESWNAGMQKQFHVHRFKLRYYAAASRLYQFPSRRKTFVYQPGLALILIFDTVGKGSRGTKIAQSLQTAEFSQCLMIFFQKCSARGCVPRRGAFALLGILAPSQGAN